jgi:hypothetical protein
MLAPAGVWRQARELTPENAPQAVFRRWRIGHHPDSFEGVRDPCLFRPLQEDIDSAFFPSSSEALLALVAFHAPDLAQGGRVGLLPIL